MRTTIIGSGSWGTALGILITSNGHPVTLVTRTRQHADQLNEEHQNPHYLPGISIPDTIRATDKLEEACKDAELILFAIPTSKFREISQTISSLIPPRSVLMSCSKGIERGTGHRMSQILAEALPNHPIAVLSGPNHAEEIARGLPAASVIGSADEPLAIELQSLVTTPTFRTYTSTDVAGIELGGAIKNIYAIASGVSRELKFGDNAAAGLVTRALAEMIRLGVRLGGKPETFAGLSGVGDLMATCFSEHSRNFKVGRALAQGFTADEAQKKLGMVAEGVPNTLSIYETSRKIGARTPLIDAIHAVLYKNQPASEMIKQLLNRDPRPESD